MRRPPVYQILRLTPREFETLPEYSASMPTGVFIGKRWKRLDGSHDRAFLAAGGKPRWLVGEYQVCAEPTKARTVWYRPHIVMRAP